MNTNTVFPPFPNVLLRRGMQGVSIRQVQERLNELGANPRLSVDGNFGPLTEAAVIAFQRANGLTPDGIVGPITWNALFTRQPAFPGVLLRRGMSGESVRQVQERLNALGANPRLATDGIFGPLTEAAVIAFQRANGLSPDGIVGPITWGALFSGSSRRWTVVVDPGHGGHDVGAVMGNRRESDDVLRLSLAVRQRLLARGVNVIMTRTTDTFVPLSERSAISNRNNADLFISIHRNAATNPNANGVDNFVFTTAPNRTLQFAFNVLDRVVGAGVQRNRGVKRENFAVLRNTNAPATLLEMGFITNPRDNQLFDQNLNAYADAITNGIIATLQGQTVGGRQFYTVAAGDSLSRIAQQFGTTQNALIQLNRLTSANIDVGQVLRIP